MTENHSFILLNINRYFIILVKRTIQKYAGKLEFQDKKLSGVFRNR